MIKFRMPLLAVRDVEISKKFYHDLFDQEVVLDLGGNVTFSGGFSVQQDFDRLTGVPKSTILHQSHNMDRAAYWRQVKNGKYIRMALIMTLLGLKDPKAEKEGN